MSEERPEERKVPNKNFDSAMKKLVGLFGEGFNCYGLADSNHKAIPTGHDDLDCMLTKGAHGIFLGGIIEISGAEGSGKTSIALRTIGRAQKMGYRCCWFDAEAAFTEDVAILNGCDPTKMVLPDLVNTKATDSKNTSKDTISIFNSAQILEMIYRSVVSGVFGLVVLDSVAGLVPARVLSENFDADSVGVAELARNMATLLPKIAQACKKTETSVIFINQLRDQVGAYFKDQFHTPGGKALKFFAHQRIGIRRRMGEQGRVVSEIDGKDELIGHYARCIILKNRKAPPVPENVVIEIPIYYRHYDPDNAKKCYDLARKLQVITTRQGVLTWKFGETIMLQEEGEAAILDRIRKEKMEPQLAAAIVEAGGSDKNLNKKNPVQIPPSINVLAKQTHEVKQAQKAVQKSKRSRPAIDLD